MKKDYTEPDVRNSCNEITLPEKYELDPYWQLCILNSFRYKRGIKTLNFNQINYLVKIEIGMTKKEVEKIIFQEITSDSFKEEEIEFIFVKDFLVNIYEKQGDIVTIDIK